MSPSPDPAPGVVVTVLDGGMSTTVQDTPGRLGYWMVGVPPSGAMDDLALRFGNRIVGNGADAAGLECTVTGPTLRFERAATIALTGADLPATLDGRVMPYWSPIPVGPGSVLRVGAVVGAGMRAYVAVRGGIDVPRVLGSRATFDLGRLGGHEGRALQAGDGLSVGCDLGPTAPSPLPPGCWPTYGRRWEIGVLEGPHAAPEYFTVEGFEAIVGSPWRVQRHAARTGVRLDGPTPAWARDDGGEAGLHPSNIHDTGYAFGAVDFTGDTPVILGPDGPSLGGFTCPAVVAAAERWKVGQLAPGDEVRLVVVDEAWARDRAATLDHRVARLRRGSARETPARSTHRSGGVMARGPAAPDRPEATYRRAGDEFVLVEFGPMVLDLALRARIHALEEWLTAHLPDPVIDTTAGVRSLLVHYDAALLSSTELIELLRKGDDELGAAGDLTIDSRIVRLPLSWEDPSTLEAIERYTNLVRDDAPWCPSNLEFIRRINGLDTIEDVHRIVFAADYLVLGLGDVYLGAPVATPLDPRHRLVTTKYNPARTWTPENAVGIGGAYLCVYGMEGPGGYQFVGRTIPVWYPDHPTPGPEPDRPWLLRHFDQLRFFPVSAEELLDRRADARNGTGVVEIEASTFSLSQHQARLAADADSISAFRARQAGAFAAERQRWRSSGEI